jgi:hypothetical protein
MRASYCGAEPLLLTAGLTSNSGRCVVAASGSHNMTNHWWFGLSARISQEGCPSNPKKLWLHIPGWQCPFEFHGFWQWMRTIPLQRSTFTLRDNVWNPCFISCDYMVWKIIAFLVITHQTHQNSTHMLALMLFSEHPWHPSCTHFFCSGDAP